MKKFLLTSLLLVFALFALSVKGVSAKVMSSENGNITISEKEVVDDDLFVGAQTVNIDGVVNGDVFIGSQAIKITGTVNGNLHVGANTVEIQGVVKGNVYAGGQSVILDGAKVGGSVLAGGSTVLMDNESTVGGSILAGAGSLSIDSQVKRGVYAWAGSINLGESAVVGKDFYYASDPDQTIISDKAKIGGSTYVTEPETSKEFNAAMQGNQFATFMNQFMVTGRIISLLGALIVGFLYFKLFGKHFEQSSSFVASSFWKSMGVGFLVVIGFIPALILLLFTVIGVPVAGLLFLMFIIYSYLAKIVVGMSLGGYMVKRFGWKMSTFAVFAVGLTVVYVLKMIPVVGGFVTVFVYLTGLGALTLQTLVRKSG